MELSNNLRIRLAEERDLLKIFPLYSDAMHQLQQKGIDQWDEIYPDEATLSADVRSGEMLLLEESGKLVSAAVVNEDQAPEYGEVGWRIRRMEPPAVIHRLCVCSQSQGRGLGLQTLLAAEQFAFSRGFRYIRLDAFPHNIAAIRLYESAGYEKAGTVRFPKGIFVCYEKNLEVEAAKPEVLK